MDGASGRLEAVKKWWRVFGRAEPSHSRRTAVAYGAGSPHQAPKEWIDKFKGRFDTGWDRYREMTFDFLAVERVSCTLTVVTYTEGL